jgi:hypothetical protein
MLRSPRKRFILDHGRKCPTGICAAIRELSPMILRWYEHIPAPAIFTVLVGRQESEIALDPGELIDITLMTDCPSA